MLTEEYKDWLRDSENLERWEYLMALCSNPSVLYGVAKSMNAPRPAIPVTDAIRIVIDNENESGELLSNDAVLQEIVRNMCRKMAA